VHLLKGDSGVDIRVRVRLRLDVHSEPGPIRMVVCTVPLAPLHT